MDVEILEPKLSLFSLDKIVERLDKILYTPQVEVSESPVDYRSLSIDEAHIEALVDENFRKLTEEEIVQFKDVNSYRDSIIPGTFSRLKSKSRIRKILTDEEVYFRGFVPILREYEFSRETIGRVILEEGYFDVSSDYPRLFRSIDLQLFDFFPVGSTQSIFPGGIYVETRYPDAGDGSFSRTDYTFNFNLGLLRNYSWNRPQLTEKDEDVRLQYLPDNIFSI